MASFYVIQGNDQGLRFELLESTSTIGRDPGNQIQIRDPEVSRRHARVEYVKEGVYRLVDDRSANGIIVNGTRVRDCVLTNGDQVRMGQTRLLFALNPLGDSSRQDDFTYASTDREDESERYGSGVISAVGDDHMRHFPLLDGSESWSPEAVGHLKMMYHATLVTTQTLEIGVLLHRILDLISQWVDIDRACIMIHDQESLQLVPRAIWHAAKENPSEKRPRFAINQSIVSYVSKRHEGVLTSDTRNAVTDKDGRWNVRDVICVPMLGRYGFVGVIYIDKLKTWEPFTGDTPPPTAIHSQLVVDHLRLMIAIAHQAALAVEDTRYYKGMIHAERLAAVGQTVTTLSHHIKNILQGINGGSHLIQTGLDTHDEKSIARGWTIVEKNQKRISNLVLDMLAFSKEREPAYELANLSKTVADVVELMQGQAREDGVEMVFEVRQEIPEFFFDVEQVHRALTNIITNGIDAAGQRAEPEADEAEVDSETDTLVSIKAVSLDEPRKGELRIDVEFLPERSVVLIRIDDNGPGIPEAQRKYLFRPFYSRKKGRGTGLGLPVAHKVIREHGGVIRIADSPLGGARFEVELPIIFEPPNSKEALKAALEAT